jgi:hypothetical protein
MRNFKETIAWYHQHDNGQSVGFDPHGMCLKICRTARGLPAKYGTAKEAQDATPAKYRVTKVSDIRKGMVAYFDDPHDSNKAGHITTVVGRVKGADKDDLNDVLVETNDVKSGQIVVVRATYFEQHWGDPFQFAATWLNGHAFDVKGDTSLVAQFRDGGPKWDVKLLDKALKNGRHEVKPIIEGIEKAIASLPHDKDDSRVNDVKETFEKTRVVKLGELHQAILHGRTGQVKVVRDQIRTLIKRLPER